MIVRRLKKAVRNFKAISHLQYKLQYKCVKFTYWWNTVVQGGCIDECGHHSKELGAILRWCQSSFNILIFSLQNLKKKLSNATSFGCDKKILAYALIFVALPQFYKALRLFFLNSFPNSSRKEGLFHDQFCIIINHITL